MGRLMVLLLPALLVMNYAVSQHRPDFAGIDKSTYDLYMASSWKELINTGESALEQGVDYYYLRMRIGIAAYELEDYSKAIRHFRKALEFNSADDVAKEYLYFACKFYGREMEAHKVAQSFSRSLREKLSYGKRAGVQSFSLNITHSFLQNREITDENLTGADEEIDGFRSVTLNFTSLVAGLQHSAGNSSTVTHALGYLSKTYIFQSQESAEITRTDDSGLSQFQYYLSGRFLTGNTTYIIPAIHYVNVRIPYYTTAAGPGRRTFLIEQYVFNHDFAASLGVEKYFGKIRTGISAGYSNINDQQQVQGSFSFTLFPLGNLDLYSYSDITWYTVVAGNDREGGPVFSQDLGFRAFPGLWIELWGSWGETRNFAASRAFLIYNDTGIIREQYGIRLIAPFISRSLELSLNYSWNLQESLFWSALSPEYIPIDPIEVNNHKITGGIKWKF